MCEYYSGFGCANNNNNNININNNNNNKIHPDLVKLHKDIDRTKDWGKNKDTSSKLPFITEHDDDELEIHSIWGNSNSNSNSYYDKFFKYSWFKSSRVKNMID
jgi:hypothetical protein